MKNFICSSCGKQWYDDIDEGKVLYCPYCAKEIPKTKEKEIIVDSFDKALLKVIHLLGKEVLKDKKKLIACLYDLAQEYKKEIKIFSRACSPEFLQMFYVSDTNDNIEHKQTVNKAKMILLEEEGVAELWTDTIVNALVSALGWENDALLKVTSTEKNNNLKGNYVDESYINAEKGNSVVFYREDHVVGGKVVATGDDSWNQCDIGDWKDIVSITCGYHHTVAVRKDGAVVAVGNNKYGQCNVGTWKDIVSVSGGYDHTVGVRKDGAVVAVGNNKYGQCNVGTWKDIMSVSCGGDHTVAVRKDGVVVAVGDNLRNQCNVKTWKDIVSIACGGSHTVGLRKDGRVVAIGSNEYGQCNVESWENIVSVSCGSSHTVGLKKDGRVIAIGNNKDVGWFSKRGQCDVEDWKDIVSIACGASHTVGLRKDGRVVAVGDNGYGSCDVEYWSNIIFISCGFDYTVGLEKQ